MRKMFCLAVFVFLLLPFSYSYGFSEKGGDCSKCHTLSKEEVTTLLQGFAQPDLKVLGIMEVPVKGIWEVDVESGGKKGLIYIDFSKKYLITGALIDIKDKKNLSQEKLTQLNKIDVSRIPLDDAIVMGDKDAKYKIIVFDDPV